MDKMTILDLQSNLQSEIQAKETIRKELSTSKAVQVSLEKWATDCLSSYHHQKQSACHLQM